MSRRERGTQGRMQKDVLTLPGRGQNAHSRKRATTTRKLLVEAVEERVLMAVFDVTTVLDNVGAPPAGSLRQAILDANATAGDDTIRFVIPGGGVKTITLAGALDPITERVFLEGQHMPGFAGTPLVEVDGNATASPGLDFTAAAASSLVQSIAIGNFDGPGIRLLSDSTSVLNSFVGLHADGITTFANTGDGIIVSNASNNIIGDGSVANANRIANNGLAGVTISGATSSGNSIRNNLISNNTGLGIRLLGGANDGQAAPVISSAQRNASDTVINGTVTGAASSTVTVDFYANTTGDPSGSGEGQRYLGSASVPTDGAGNGTFSVTLATTVTAAETITATTTRNNGSTSQFGLNFIPLAPFAVTNTAATGLGSLAQALANANVIPGTDTIQFLLTGGGPYIINPTVANPLPSIIGPVILDATTQAGFAGTPIVQLSGTSAGAGANGLTLAAGSNGSTIRGLSIVSFAGAGIAAQSDGGTITANWLGVTAAGVASGNTGDGVLITGSNNVVGDGTNANANRLENNGGAGVFVSSGSGNSIRNDVISNNTGLGIRIAAGANNNQAVPVITSAQKNATNTVINGTVTGAASSTVTVDFYANTTGDPSGSGEGQRYLGSASVPTDGAGNGTFSVTLATTVTAAETITATSTRNNGSTSQFALNFTPLGSFAVTNTNLTGLGSLQQALLNANASAGTDTIQFLLTGGGPYIISPTVANPLPSIIDPVILDATTQAGFAGTPIVQLSGTSAGAGANGLTLAAGSNGSTIRGLSIVSFAGAGIAAQSDGGTITANWLGVTAAGVASGNTGDGVLITGSNNVVGDGTNANANRLENNGGAGVFVSSGSGNSIRNDVISNNTGLGIRVAAGANNNQTVPVITSAQKNATNTVINGTVTGAASSTVTVDFYANITGDPSGSGEGQRYLGSASVPTDGAGNGTFSVTLATTVAVAESITATTTRNNGSTSQFALNFAPLSAFAVTNTNASGVGSLRQALLNANASAGTDTIQFVLTGGGPYIISPTVANPLPSIIDPVILDATTQAGFAGTPIVQLSGTSAGAGANGLTLAAGSNGSTIRGLSIVSFAGAGIAAQSDGGTITANWLGVTAAGVASGNTGDGVLITGSNNVVGDGTNANANRLENNGGAGVFVSSGSGNSIRNDVISNNTGLGIRVNAGANNDQAVAVITAAQRNIGSTFVNGTVTGAASSTVTVDFYANTTGDPSGSGEGQRYLGSTTVPTDGAGNGTFSVSLATTVTAAETVTATTTRNNGSTSQFALNVTPQSPLTVTNANSTGLGSLQQALLNANAIPGTDTIQFLISGAAPFIISPTVANPLPTIIGPLILDATTQAGFAGSPIVQLSGTSAGAGVNGLTLGAGSNGSTIRGLSIVNFAGAGILTQSSGNTIQGNFLGVTTAGAASGNLGDGLIVTGSNNLIGGPNLSDPNRIENSGAAGVFLSAGVGNTLRRNIIFNSGGLGIRMNPGANNDQAAPTLTGLVAIPGSTTIEGSVVGPANTSVTIDFYGTTSPDPSGAGEGQRVLGTVTVALNASGTGTFLSTLGLTLNPGEVVTAILSTNNGSSAFALNLAPVANPLAVTNTNPSGVGSLRQAIINANSIPGANVITFQIPGAAPFVIQPLSALPTITETLTIDATLQAGFVGTPIVVLSGVGAGASVPGLVLGSGATNSVVRGLVIQRFSGPALLVQAAGSVIEGNFLGTNVAGSAASANALGVVVDNAANVRIGGTVAGAGNVISGNDGSGVVISGAASTGVLVQGNKIGYALDGVAALGNNGDGVRIQTNATGAQIGGIAANAGNQIGNNSLAGVAVNGGSGHSILGNVLFANAGLGIALAAGANAGILAPTVVAASSITVPAQTLIEIELTGRAPSTTYTIELYSNTIADPSGAGEGQEYLSRQMITTDAAGNARTVIQLGITVPLGRQISATITDAAGNTSQFAVNTLVQNAVIVNTTADSGIGSLRQAIANANSTVAPDRILFQIPGVGPFTIQPLSPLPSITAQLEIDGGNQPGFLGVPIIEIVGAGAGAGAVGLDLAAGSSGSVIRNLVIRNFAGAGIQIESNDNTVAATYLGTSLNGSLARPNGIGVLVNGGANNLIGGTFSGDRNLISGNTGAGVELRGASATNNLIWNNFVGVALNSVTALGNGGPGVLVSSGASNNLIGGSAANTRNLIANNAGAGVLVASGSGNAILGNILFANGGLGIQLGVGANGSIPAPVLSAATSFPGTTAVQGQFTGTPNTTYRLEFYTNPAGQGDPSGAGEGRTFLAARDVTTNAAGLTSFFFEFALSVPLSDLISATITDPLGDTSAFAQNVLVTSAFVVTNNSSTDIFTNTDAAGIGSLHQVLLNANRNPGLDAIVFQIGAGGPQTIRPVASLPLPVIVDPVLIDASTQPGFTGAPIIELDGALAGAVSGLVVNVTASPIGSTIRGLVINSFGGFGVELLGNGSNVLEVNEIGTDAGGSTALGNGLGGVRIVSSNNRVGGTTLGTRNLISGNQGPGVQISGDNNLIQNNIIGAAINETSPLGNTGAGIEVLAGQRNSLRTNVIFANGGLGISIAPGANNNQLSQFTVDASTSYQGTTAVQGRIQGAANTTYRVEFFSNPSGQGDPSGAGEGQRLIAVRDVLTNGSGSASYFFEFGVTLTVGDLLTATAADPSGNTSAFAVNATVGSAFVVTNTNTVDLFTNADSTGIGSLGLVLLNANRNPGLDIVTFAIGVGAATIQPSSSMPLPTITDPIVIDATSQPGFAGSPLVELDGTNAGNVSGLVLNGGATGSTIRGLVINRFAGAGIELRSGSHVIAGNFLGTDRTGALSRGNQVAGVLVQSSFNQIGGSAASDQNVISGNLGAGVLVTGLSATNNRIERNLIGTGINGSTDVGNIGPGVRFTAGASSNTVGGSSGVGNTIWFNASGVAVESGNSNAVLSNSIFNNDGDGIVLSAGANRDQAAPVITGVNSLSASTVVQGNLQVDVAGQYTLEFFTNTVGDTREGRTLLASTTVDISTIGTFQFLLSFSGVTVAPGLTVTATATSPLLDTSSFSSNVSPTNGFVVTNTNDSGLGSLRQAILNSNANAGVDTITFFIGAGAATIFPFTELPALTDAVIVDATTQPGYAGNPIIELAGDIAGTANGLVVTATNGGSTIRGLVINGFIGTGIVLRSANNLVQNVWIGPALSGSFTFPNTVGLLIDNASNNVVGGSTAATRVIVSGNTGAGIQIQGMGATGNRIVGNWIGLQADGVSSLANGGSGVLITTNASNNRIGGPSAAEGNVIANNAGAGIDAASGSGNTFSANVLYSNSVKSIRLASGANNNQPTPLLVAATVSGGFTVVDFDLSGTAGTTATIEFFLSPGPLGSTPQPEARSFFARRTVTFTTTGVNRFSISDLPATALNQIVTATATRNNGSTSELSQGTAIADLFTVTNTADNGVGSLRQAILNANVNPDLNRIVFNINTSSPQINLLTSLPVVAFPVILDATTQPGFFSSPIVTVSGAGIVDGFGDPIPGVDGLVLGDSAGGSTIRGLVLVNFSGNGMHVLSDNNVIQTNYFGISADGFDSDLSREANSINGLLLENSSGNLIGGSDYLVSGQTVRALNIMSGNDEHGLRITGAGSFGNVVSRNYFGVDQTGGRTSFFSYVYNSLAGIRIDNGAYDNLIGGLTNYDARDAFGNPTISGDFNVIAGNTRRGIEIADGAHDNIVSGNLVGTDSSGSAFIVSAEFSSPNWSLQDGVAVLNASNNLIGGDNLLERNVLSGNNRNGVFIEGVNASGNVVSANVIGTDSRGQFSGFLVANFLGGVVVKDAPGNRIGGPNGQRNIVSGNFGDGISIQGVRASDNLIENNYVGIDITGNNTNIDLANGANGVLVNSAVRTIVRQNVLSGNLGSGVAILGTGARMDTMVVGNKIGTNSNGGYDLGNSLDGVLINNSAGNTIGGTTLDTRNVITGNSGFGISILGLSSEVNVVQGNLIGQSVSGIGSAGNAFNGVRIDQQARMNLIGGSLSGQGNLISGNGFGSIQRYQTSTRQIGAPNQSVFPTDYTAVASGDFNGDGLLDVAVTDRAGDGVQIFLADSTGAFRQSATIRTGIPNGDADPSAIVSGDFNGDGFLDLIVTEPGDSDIAILRGRGDGTFQSPTFLSTGAAVRPERLSAADFDGSAGLDLVILDSANQIAQLMTNTGSSFALGGSIGAGMNLPSDLASIDLLNDGGPRDFVVTNRGNNTVTLYRNNGSGGFSLSGTFSVGQGPSSLAVGDLNSDGFADVVVTNADDNTVSILINNGMGGFTLQPRAQDVGGNPVSVSLGDIDNDGRVDIVTANRGSNNITILSGNGDGTFQLPVNFDAGQRPTDLVIAPFFATNPSVVVINGTQVNARSGLVRVSGFQSSGVLMTGGATANTLQGNFIGTSPSGTDPRPNAADGVLIVNARDNVVGGSTASASNLISANTRDGVRVTGVGSTGNLIQGNRIGVDPTGRSPLGNGSQGVFLDASQAAFNLSNTKVLGNTISANGINGILVQGGLGTLNQTQIAGNKVGTNIDGRLQPGVGLGNLASGVVFRAVSGLTLGGPALADGNIIGLNRNHGVEITDGSSGNFILSNRIGVDVDGSGPVPNGIDGIFVLNSPGNTIGAMGSGNVISSNRSNGIRIRFDLLPGGGPPPDSRTRIEANLIGTDALGSSVISPLFQDLGNGIDGVFLDRAQGGSFATGTMLVGNVISGNRANGVRALDSTFLTIQGNLIGTGRLGNELGLGNALFGLTLDDTTNAIVGGFGPGQSNVISGNRSVGLRIEGARSTDNTIQNNFIGTSLTGREDVGNSFIGVLISAAHDNVVDRNVISGNDFIGLSISGPTASGNRVIGNKIGTTIDGRAGLANLSDGILINNAPGNTVGGLTAADRNIISGNRLSGIQIAGVDSRGNQVLGNYIGLDVDGRNPIANASDGVFVNNAPLTVIGQAVAGSRNIISANSGNGVRVFGLDSAGTSITNNIIGLDVDGRSTQSANGLNGLGNLATGVQLTSTRSVTVGDDRDAPATLFSDFRNMISNNGQSGVVIDSSEMIRVVNNFIGTDIEGIRDFGNAANGVNVNASVNQIQIGMPNRGNVISGNNQSGVLLSASDHVAVLSNLIGTDRLGSIDLGNGANGVYLIGSNNNVIGQAGSGNVISGNEQSGVQIFSPSVSALASNNSVQGNTIGLGLNRVTPIGNAGDGVLLLYASNNQVGGDRTRGEGNFISANFGNGVQALGTPAGEGQPSTAMDNAIQGNIIGLNLADAAVGNLGNGILLINAPKNRIGGELSTSTRNVISGNGVSGIQVFGASTETTIQGNFIGTDSSGFNPRGNGSHGIFVNNAANNVIGGTTPTARNIISANSNTGRPNEVSVGVHLFGDGASNNRVMGNYIGTDVSGSRDLGNTVGVFVNNAPNNPITGNVISGNDDVGVHILGVGSKNIVVQGNLIGLNAAGDGTLFVASAGFSSKATGDQLQGTGVLIEDTPGHLVGGTDAASRNYISGNRVGVQVAGAISEANRIFGNWFGLDVSGTRGIGNAQIGVYVNNAPRNEIRGNVVAATGVSGIQLYQTGATGNLIVGNQIGMDAAGVNAIPNQHGIAVIGASGNFLGKTGQGNRIAGNSATGIYISRRDFDGRIYAITQKNKVEGNTIGQNTRGKVLGNGSFAILRYNSPFNEIILRGPGRNIIRTARREVDIRDYVPPLEPGRGTTPPIRQPRTRQPVRAANVVAPVAAAFVATPATAKFRRASSNAMRKG